MVKVDDKNKSPAAKANDARPPSDGPHKPGAKRIPVENPEDGAPPYIISVTKRGPNDPKPDPVVYDPKALRAKAKSFLNSGNLDAKERKVLEEILGPDTDDT